MVIKAAVIAVDGAHKGIFIVSHQAFGVVEAWLKFHHFDAGFKHWVVISLGHNMHIPFVWYMRGANAHIHAALGGQG